MKVLSDFHHTSLYSSLQMLFEERLGAELYRPIGMEWFHAGAWKINNQLDTAEQFLSLDQTIRPSDGTKPLNLLRQARGWGQLPSGVYEINNPEYRSRPHTACTLEYFKNTPFDVLIASIPDHIRPFQELIRKYHPKAKLIVQIGNRWNVDLRGMNVLASVARQPSSPETNIQFYHQEFDTSLFRHDQPQASGSEIHNYVNVLQGSPRQTFRDMERLLPEATWREYGAQNRDGCIDGGETIADSMKRASLIYHNKPGADGYGHCLHTAFAVGRPLICSRRQYKGTLGGELMTAFNCVNIDGITNSQVVGLTRDILANPDRLEAMSRACSVRFMDIVSFDEEAAEISKWVESIV